MIEKRLFVILIVFIMATINVAYGQSSNNFHPWVALSTLWGQGGLGIGYKPTDLTYNLNYNFVANWASMEFTYNEVDLNWDYDRYKSGIKYRNQLSNDEISPYAGYLIPFNNKILPLSIYNEVEYRIHSLAKDDYFRSRHVFSLYANNYIVDKIFIRPYIAFDAYIELDEFRREKNRLNIGYFINLKKAIVRVYYIPWSMGVKDQEWDDQNSFGASLTYRW